MNYHKLKYINNFQIGQEKREHSISLGNKLCTDTSVLNPVKYPKTESGQITSTLWESYNLHEIKLNKKGFAEANFLQGAYLAYPTQTERYTTVLNLVISQEDEGGHIHLNVVTVLRFKKIQLIQNEDLLEWKYFTLLLFFLPPATAWRHVAHINQNALFFIIINIFYSNIYTYIYMLALQNKTGYDCAMILSKHLMTLARKQCLSLPLQQLIISFHQFINVQRCV